MRSGFRQRRDVRSPVRAARLLPSLPALLTLAAIGLSAGPAVAQEARVLPACVLPALGTDQGPVSSVHVLADGGILLQTARRRELNYTHEWSRLDPATGRITPAGTLTADTFGAAGAGSLPLPGGALLLRGGNQLFVYDPSLQRVVRLPITGFVDRALELPDGKGALLMAGTGLHHYTPDGKIAAVRLPDAAAILGAGVLPAGRGVYIRTERALFRFDGALSPLVDRPSAVESLPDGLLIQNNKGWHRYDAPANALRNAGSTDGSWPHAIADLPNGGKLIVTDAGWLRYDPVRKAVLLVAAGAPPVRVRHMARMSDGTLLIADLDAVHAYGPAASRPTSFRLRTSVEAMVEVADGIVVKAAEGAFYYDAAQRQLRFIGNTDPGAVRIVKRLSDQATLIVGDRGVFRYDAQPRRLSVVHESLGYIGDAHALPNGDVLVFELAGNLLRYDAGSGRVAPVGRIEAGGPVAPLRWHDLPGGGVLVGSTAGLFVFDPRRGTAEAISGAPTGAVHQAIRLGSRNDILVHAANGLFMAPALPLDQSKVRPLRPDRFDRDTASADRVEMTIAFEHPCAPVADRLGLRMELTLNGVAGPPVSVRVPFGEAPTAAVAPLTASFVFDRPGAARLQLRQGSQPVGPALPFTIAEPSLAQRLVSGWKWLSGAAAVLYALAFATLVVLAHRSTTAFRLLSDAAWAKWLTWPFFFLRHVPAVQRWVLEPWYQNVRRATATDVPFLDPPAAHDGAQVEASTLLDRLKATRRLWLQGGSGMGKSSVFAAWERAFFTAGDRPTLAAAVRHRGFVLVPLRLRDHAGLSVPQAHRPESWLIEAVRRRFEQSGFPVRDSDLAAMLTTGHFALALDGMNETDHDGAIAAFATQFPMVPMLVTSQARGGPGWQTWSLPADMGGLSDGLLRLWLGPIRGDLLARRLADARGLAGSIASGYDLRLLADLAADDPQHAALPADRIALYRAMLAHAADLASEPLRLDGLKRLAWNLLAVHRRREILPEDASVLGTGTLRDLAREGVRIVRQRGTAYEFRHDQMRAFLAALWLIEETPGQPAFEAALLDADIFALGRLDQEGLWRFVAPLLDDASLVALWRFASADPESRSLLLAALQRDADRRGVRLVRLPADDVMDERLAGC